MKYKIFFIYIFICFPCSAFASSPALDKLPMLKEHYYRTAEGSKKNEFLKEGVFVCGQKNVTESHLLNIRRSLNGGQERIVFDFQGADVPYSHFHFVPHENRILISFWSKTSFTGFPKEKVAATFEKSQWIKRISVFPQLEEEFVLLELQLKAGKNSKRQIETFTLPSRIVLDVI